MQSRRTLLCNRLFEQSCPFSPATVAEHCKLRNEGGVQNVRCQESRELSVECRVECEMGTEECGVQSVRSGVENLKCRECEV